MTNKHGIYVLVMVLALLGTMIPTMLIMFSAPVFNIIVPEYFNVEKLHTTRTLIACIVSYVCGNVLLFSAIIQKA